MTITVKQLSDASEIAMRLGNDRDSITLQDLTSSFRRYGSLTPRQADFAQNLINRNSEAAIAANADWENRWRVDEELREKAEVIAKYYSKTGYFRNVVNSILASIRGDTTVAPRMQAVMRMIENKYAEKVWQSYKAPPKWKVGDMVTIRLSCKGELPYVNGIARTPWQAENSNLPCIYDLSYMIVAVDSKPIDQAYAYSKTAGGTRYYRVIPVGLAVQFDIMECNLKKLLKRQVT